MDQNLLHGGVIANIGSLEGFTEGKIFKTFSIVIALQVFFGGIEVLIIAYFSAQFIFLR